MPTTVSRAQDRQTTLCSQSREILLGSHPATHREVLCLGCTGFLRKEDHSTGAVGASGSQLPSQRHDSAIENWHTDATREHAGHTHLPTHNERTHNSICCCPCLKPKEVKGTKETQKKLMSPLEQGMGKNPQIIKILVRKTF